MNNFQQQNNLWFLKILTALVKILTLNILKNILSI